jgi:endonuclease/exonuclease/phosphatase family metal-dependent hydrolase
MKVLSWNILADEFISKRYYPMIPSDLLFKRARRLERILTLLTAEDADVMLLQEVMLSEYNALVGQFARMYHIIKSKNIIWQGIRSHTYNVVLLRKNMFTIKGASLHHFDFGLVVNCFLKYGPASYIPITICNVHLDDLNKGKRLKQLEEIEPYLLGVNNVILGGDFNENYSISSSSSKSSSSKSSIYNKVESYGLKIMNQSPTHFIGRKMCIDNIMLKGHASRPRVRVINDYDNDILQHFMNYGSDHLPVVVITK